MLRGLAKSWHVRRNIFDCNAARMRYPEFRAQGLFVGSGVIEAGCKAAIGSRLKQSAPEHHFWDAHPVSARSRAGTNTRIRCVVVGPSHEIRWTAWKFFMWGYAMTCRREVRPVENLWIEHAGRDAIGNAYEDGQGSRHDRRGDHTVHGLCVAIVRAGIVRVLVCAELLEPNNVDLLQRAFRDD